MTTGAIPETKLIAMPEFCNKALFFTFSILLISFCQPSSIRSATAAVDESLIKDEIQEIGPQRPFLVRNNEVAQFREAYHKKFGEHPVSVAMTGENTVFLMTESQAKSPELATVKIVSAGKRPPFVFFDPSYAARLGKGYTSIDDLISGYKDAGLNELLLAGIVRAHPDMARLHIIGTTAMGRNILALEMHNFKVKEKKIPVLFTCAMHANELTATEHCYSIIHSILSDSATYAELLDHVSLWIIPIANPDGSHLFWHYSTAMGRKNGRRAASQPATSLMSGIDLNRNFPFRWNSGHPKASSGDPNSVYYRGSAPASEAETQAIMQLAERERFVSAISFHAVSGKILIPYTIENVKNPNPDYASALARELVPITRPHNRKRGFRAVKNIYPVDGTDQDFLYFQYGTLAYIIESSYRNCEYQYVHYYLEGYQPLWNAFIRDYERNLKFALKITNVNGEPLQAEVQFSDLRQFESEKHTSNPRDGTFIRLTKAAAIVEVTVSAPGYRTARARLRPQGTGYPAFFPITLQE